MKVAIITPEYITEVGFDGGLANYIHNISLGLHENGHAVFIIVASDKNESFELGGVTIVRVKIQTSFLKWFQRLFRGCFYAPIFWLLQSQKLNEALRELHEANDLDIVQCASYTGTAYFKAEGIPYVTRLSSYQPLLDEANELPKTFSRLVQHYIERAALQKSDAIFGPSSLITNIVAQKMNKKIKVIESPLHLNNEQNPRLYEEQLKHKKYLLFFGSLGLLKGLKEIAAILPELLSEFTDLHFVFIGKDFGYQGQPMIDYVRAQAGEYQNRCVYFGSIKQDELWPILGYSEAVVLPSRVDNFPNACIESMSKGKIVIGTEGASFEQLIQNGKNGFLCEKENPVALLRVIRDVLLLDASTKAEIECKAKATTARLNPEVIASELEFFYRKVINEFE